MLFSVTFIFSVLSDLKNFGVKDIFIVRVDRLTGLLEANETTRYHLDFCVTMCCYLPRWASNTGRDPSV